MKRFKNIVYIAIFSFVWLYHMNFQQMAYAEDSLGEGIDCTDVSVDYLENSMLTKEERIRLMDKAFFQSLNKFELCQEAKKMAAAGGGGSVGGSGGGRVGVILWGCDFGDFGVSFAATVARRYTR